ncbi:MAG: preprotein translocase subunit SecG [Sneathiella sp.]|jgi:preprotein translocase subunit SecG|uniref:preprotein translocase subunit SecG n=1 Tax=Sneathiella sp. TaxID=1964365 RepID=UPI000C3E7C37|nr:preprotein translocase subunit SecG [Sneathiella sp.]MAL79680.1 preprotein translocase subunit SecG [Sneathiella sp.]|tara:strand:+ start:3073 stop:3405 length:333 start_codon:yes stop_codon:yes gene_type:complete
METVLLVIHIVIAVAIVGVVLLQRSEGGALGIGGSGGTMTTRGAANFLTRTTAGLAAAFMLTSIMLAFVSGTHTEPTSILDVPSTAAPTSGSEVPTAPTAPAEPSAPLSQ